MLRFPSKSKILTPKPRATDAFGTIHIFKENIFCWGSKIVSKRFLPIPLPPDRITISKEIFYYFKKIYWSIVDLQCFVNFRCMAKWVIFTYIFRDPFFSHISYYRILNRFPYVIQQVLVIHFIHSMYVLIPNSFLSTSPPFPFGTHKFVFEIWLCFCFVNKFFCIIFY